MLYVYIALAIFASCITARKSVESGRVKYKTLLIGFIPGLQLLVIIGESYTPRYIDRRTVDHEHLSEVLKIAMRGDLPQGYIRSLMQESMAAGLSKSTSPINLE